MKSLSVFGATGSVGTSVLDVVRLNRDNFRINVLSAHSNMASLAKLCHEFKPSHVWIPESSKNELESLLGQKMTGKIRILAGSLAVGQAVEASDELVVAAISGAAGIESVFRSVQKGLTVAIANKESLVLAGGLISSMVKRRGNRLIPLDSEHNAIYQILVDKKKPEYELILTASGGPFLNRDKATFKDITLEEALRHPNWNMGKKISIDSATMMNKALEIIEARWLFGINPTKIKVLIHPESIIHGMITFADGSVLAHLSKPDMRVPAGYCLYEETRKPTGVETLDFAKIGSMTFGAPDMEKFPSINLAYRCLAVGEGAPPALNGANEEAVTAFMDGKLRFDQILEVLVQLTDHMEDNHSDFSHSIIDIDEAIRLNNWGANFVRNWLNQ